ncbi:MAG: hypothetical protein LIO93_02095 [Bacteroidales bacterium]|nr:hypothetical protein [Bacteroidales bacterium]
MKYIYCIKLIIFLLLVNTSFPAFSQVGIGTDDPQGILDVRSKNPQMTDASAYYGLVLPRVENVESVTNPTGGEVPNGTIVYDLSSKCVRYKKSDGWSECLLNDEGLRMEINEKLGLGIDLKAKKVSCGYNYTLIIGEDDNAIWVAGDNSNSRTGLGRTSGNTGVFTLMMATPTEDVSAGQLHAIAATKTGEVYVWGSNSNYRTGLGITGTTATPTRVAGFGTGEANGKAIRVEAGNTASFILTENGDVYAAGAAAFTGTGAVAQTFTKISTLSNIKDISASYRTAAALDQDGNVYVWGTGSYGILGTGSTSNVSIPQQIVFDKPIEKIVMGGYTGVAFSTDKKTVYRWGVGEGVASPSNLTVPTELVLPGFDPEISDILFIAAQKFDQSSPGNIIIGTDNEVYVTGYNRYGQLGIGNTSNQATINTINRIGLHANINFTGAAVGNRHVVLLTGDSDRPSLSYVAYGIGSVSYRQLGSVIRQTAVPTRLSK